MSTPLTIESGAILLLRLYDVAYAIDLSAVEALAAAPVARIRLRKVAPKAMTFGVAPLEIGLGSIEPPLAGMPAADIFGRIYEFGSITIGLRVPVRGLGWAEYVELVNRLYDWAGTETGRAQFTRSLESVRRAIATAFERPTTDTLEEDYLIAMVERFDRDLNAQEMLEECDLVPLLSGATSLAASARTELLRNRFSYYPNDLVVLTWDRAFIIEPAGDSDVADVLEVANAQLLELRYYDDLLDGELPRMYDRVEQAHKGLRPFGRRRYAQLARQLHGLVAEVTEITERIDNAVKVTEDVYLARIYASALEVFRIASWGRAVDRKLAIIRDTYSALYDDAATARAELLEFAILLLIVVELVVALLNR